LPLYRNDGVAPEKGFDSIPTAVGEIPAFKIKFEEEMTYGFCMA
jgi:hypothetical protein